MPSDLGRRRLRTFANRWLMPYLPYPHFMCAAPIDAVLRILWRAEWHIPPAYWPRLLLLLLLSGVNTVASLPERLILAAWLRLRPPRIERHQAPVFVLGYFRSGTTFLQNLLAADPALRSPRWPEVLAPQTFVLGWVILRYLFLPILPLTRLDAVVPVGASLPAEDDFALNNWGGMSILAGRAILPRRQAFFNRFQDLDSLTPDERRRWRSHQLAFVQKLTLLAGGRRLLLKSPSHTARVRYLLELFPGAKFVHISRPPEVVFRSNLLLARELQRAFALQPPLPEDRAGGDHHPRIPGDGDALSGGQGSDPGWRSRGDTVAGPQRRSHGRDEAYLSRAGPTIFPRLGGADAGGRHDIWQSAT